MPYSEDKNFYVYVIFDQVAVPIYVGKGTGLRWKKHLNGHSHNTMLNEITKQYDDIPIIILNNDDRGFNENDAFELEKLLIKIIGRVDLNTGPLLNKDSGGVGVSNYKGIRFTPEWRTRLSTARAGRKFGQRPAKFRHEQSVRITAWWAKEKKFWINDGDRSKFWPVLQPIPVGWIRGRLVPPTGGIWINNGIEEKLIFNSNIYDGWKKGRNYNKKEEAKL